MKFDIFISYKRREISSAFAALVYNYLTTKGYKVFFDRKEIRQGRFNEQLYNHIENANDVIILLEETSLKACFNEIPDAYKTDWFCKEVMHALELEKDKHIIPILLGGYQMPDPDQLPEELKLLPLQNAISLDASEMEEVFQKYFINQGYLLSKPSSSVLNRITDTTGSEGVSDFLFVSEYDCDVYECGEKLLSVPGEVSEAHPVRYSVKRSGEHRFHCINNDTCEELRIVSDIALGAQKYIELKWTRTQNLWELTPEMIDKEEDHILLNEWGQGLFWGTSTHMADHELSFKCISKAIGLGNSDAKAFVQENYVALFDLDIPKEQIMSWLEAACSQGSVNAKLSLANYYFDTDKEKAIAIFNDLGETGNVEAMMYLGKLYEKGGDGIEKDGNKAVYWYTKAIDEGNPEALCRLGILYEVGQLVPKDEAKAVSLYQKAIHKGSNVALTMLGNCYRFGIGVEVDNDKAIELYKRAVETSGDLNEVDPWSEYIMGLCYKDNGKIAEALEWFHKSARGGEGDSRAMVEIGIHFFNEKNYKLAYEWFTKGAEKESHVAHLYLGRMYKHGLYVQDDWETAQSHFHISHDAGNRVATYELSTVIYDKDPKQAFTYLKESAEGGYVKAQTALGLDYLWGSRAVEPDEELAFHWMKTAADAGDAEAMNYLATEIYIELEDYENAISYLKKSSEAGYAASMEALAELYRYPSDYQDLESAYFWLRKAATEHSSSSASTNLADLTELYPELCNDGERHIDWVCHALQQPTIREKDVEWVLHKYRESDINKLSEEDKSKLICAVTTSSDNGSLSAKRYLAEWYLKGLVPNTNHQDNIKLYEDAAESGEVNAQYQLALYYLQKHKFLHKYLTPYNPSKGYLFLEKAADAGHGNAIYNLAILYAEGRHGIVQNTGKAIELLESIHNNGLKEADTYLNKLLISELGKKNIAEYYRSLDIKKLTSSALSRIPAACKELSDRFSEGRDGVIKNTELAEYWRAQAARPTDTTHVASALMNQKLHEPHKWFWEKF